MYKYENYTSNYGIIDTKTSIVQSSASVIDISMSGQTQTVHNNTSQALENRLYKYFIRYVHNCDSLDANGKISTATSIVVLPFAIDFAVNVERLEGIDHNVIVIGTWRSEELLIFFRRSFKTLKIFNGNRTYLLILTYGQRTSSTIE